MTGPSMGARPRGPSGPYGRAALESETFNLRFRRRDAHGALYGAAVRLYQLVAGGELDADLVYGRLLEVGRDLDRPDSEIHRILRSAELRGREEPRTAPTDGVMLRDRADARTQLGDVWAAAQFERWPGKGGSTDFKVLGALVTAGMAIGKVRFWLSARDIAEMSGVSKTAVLGAVKRLQRKGWIRIVSSSKRATTVRSLTHRATTYQVIKRSAPRVANQTIAEASLPGIGRNGLVRNTTDLLSLYENGLPEDAFDGMPLPWRIHAEVKANEGHLNQTQLAELIGVHRSTINRGLRDLRAHDVVVANLDHTLSLGPTTLDEYATRTGRAGAGDRKALRHDADRDQHALAVVAHIAARARPPR